MNRLTMQVAAYLLLIRDEKILLLRRFDTGYEDGNYSLVAGHLDGGETVQQAICREAEEEAGLTIHPSDIDIVHVMHRKGTGGERIDYFCTTKNCTDEPINTEPHKCDDLSWFPLNQLPVNTIPYIQEAIAYYLENVSFSTHGF